MGTTQTAKPKMGLYAFNDVEVQVSGPYGLGFVYLANKQNYGSKKGKKHWEGRREGKGQK
jgi:hypothetical protein